MAMIALYAPRDRALRARLATHAAEAELIEANDRAALSELLASRNGDASVVLIGATVPAGEALAVAESLRGSRAGVVLVVRSLSSKVLQAAIRAGVRDVLPASFDARQLAEALERAGDTGAAATNVAGRKNRIVTVFSTKGGIGKSTVASNLAVLLAQATGQEVALVDLNLAFGDLAIMLHLMPARTIYDAAQNSDRLDAEALNGYLTPHRSLVRLLAASHDPGLADTIPAETTQRMLTMLREWFPYVVVDTPPAFTDHVLSALDVTDEIVLVTSLDVPSVKDMKVGLQTLEKLGVRRDRVRVVLNRSDSKVGISPSQVGKTLGTPIDVAIPSSRDVPLSVNRGTPVVLDNPKSPVSRALARLADLIHADAGRPQPNGRKA